MNKLKELILTNKRMIKSQSINNNNIKNIAQSLRSPGEKILNFKFII